MQDRQKSVDKGAREGPRRDFRRFWVDFGIDFRRFSRKRRASDATCSAHGRTLDFADRRGTLEGSPTLGKIKNRQKSTENRDDDALQKSRTEKLTFCVPGRDLAAILTVPKRSQAVPGAVFLAFSGTL